MRRRELIFMLGAATLVSPIAARAQQKPMPVVGYLTSGTPGSNAQYVAAFHQGLSNIGYVETQNVAVEYRWAETYDQLPPLAVDLVGRNVDVIATGNFPAALAAKKSDLEDPDRLRDRR